MKTRGGGGRSFACRVPLQQLETQSYCPDCKCKFCQRCAALALSERQRPALKRLLDGSAVVGDSLTVTQKCPTCAGSEKHEQGREAVCVLLMEKALGHRVRDFGGVNWAGITSSQLRSSKASADESCFRVLLCR